MANKVIARELVERFSRAIGQPLSAVGSWERDDLVPWLSNRLGLTTEEIGARLGLCAAAEHALQCAFDHKANRHFDAARQDTEMAADLLRKAGVDPKRWDETREVA